MPASGSPNSPSSSGIPRFLTAIANVFTFGDENKAISSPSTPRTAGEESPFYLPALSPFKTKHLKDDKHLPQRHLSAPGNSVPPVLLSGFGSHVGSISAAVDQTRAAASKSECKPGTLRETVDDKAYGR